MGGLTDLAERIAVEEQQMRRDRLRNRADMLMLSLGVGLLPDPERAENAEAAKEDVKGMPNWPE